jgi:hypothetical protein
MLNNKKPATDVNRCRLNKQIPVTFKTRKEGDMRNNWSRIVDSFSGFTIRARAII